MLGTVNFASAVNTGLTSTSIRLASDILAVIATALMGFVSYFEHIRSTRPSMLLNAYLLLLVVLGIICISRTSSRDTYGILLIASTVLAGVVAILEAVPKRRWGSIALYDKSPEESSGLYSIALFAWLNPLIRLGNRKILDTDDLYPLDTRLSANEMSQLFQQNWTNRPPGRSLPGVLLKSLFWPLVQPIPSKIAFVGFSFCQPLFIQKLIKYLESGPDASCDTSTNLILASSCIYAGMAVSSASFAYLNSRALARLRSSLVTAMFHKTVELRATHLDTEVLTLMYVPNSPTSVFKSEGQSRSCDAKNIRPFLN